MDFSFLLNPQNLGNGLSKFSNYWWVCAYKVILNIKGDFNKLSVYCYNHGYMGLSNSFIYSSDSLKGYDIACLHKTSEVMIIQKVVNLNMYSTEKHHITQIDGMD